MNYIDKYEVLAVIGRGGLGTVYKAFHPHLKKYIAIKEINSELADQVGFRRQFEQEVELLAKLPAHFRILSVRGWKDKIVTPEMIDKVFEPHPHLDWVKLSLPQAGHLNGLKDFPEEYKGPVSSFLKELGTTISSRPQTSPQT